MEKQVPRSALVQFCVAIGYDPGTVRVVHFEPELVTIERFVLDGDGTKRIENDVAVTVIDKLSVAG